ncbi:MAG: STAS domain-containing protein [Mycobacterium leprae]
MVIQALELSGSMVLLLGGDLDAVTVQELRETVLDLLDVGWRRVVLDLSGLDRIYTAGILALVELQAYMGSQDARLLCCGARPFVRELLRISLDRPLDLLPDLETALELAASV